MTGAQAQERAELQGLLERGGWNLAAAAATLGVSRMTLYRRLERLGLARPTGRGPA
jgi:transcriptional regulator of acetoin/glycerol metabolism